MEIILASASPRRRELLKMLKIENFRVIPATGDEDDCAGLTPDGAVCRLSRAKATEIRPQAAGDCVLIAADTLVYLDGALLGKPCDEAEAVEMLKRLSGRAHSVFTGVTVMRGAAELTKAEETKVYFRDMTTGEITAYVKTGEPMDKAGAYAAQGIGGLFIRRIEGDFFNVMGLPLCLLGDMLRELGVSLI